uniref:Uncharacterized protein n=1 Tax=Arundo donax TaxID=35708 RepID=A0A0A9BJX8_ARUDO
MICELDCFKQSTGLPATLRTYSAAILYLDKFS